jgi:uncharacterized membrane protein YebE (DUF533 family)
MKNAQNIDKNHISHSQFQMIRCVFAMAHADGHISDEERAYADQLIDRMPFSREQIAVLHNDLRQEQNIPDLLRQINEPRFRGQVVYFARLMAYKDGTLHPNEDDLLKYLHLKVSDGLDMDAIRADARKALQEKLSDLDAANEQGGKTLIERIWDKFFKENNIF